MNVPLTLAIDPLTISLLGLGLGAIGGATSLFSGGAPEAPAIPPAAPPVQPPVGDQNTNKSAQAPSFLAAAATPNQNQSSGAKSLLGQ